MASFPWTKALKPLRSVYQILQHRNPFFVTNSTYFSSFRKLGRRFSNWSVFFQAVLMSKSDKSLCRYEKRKISSQFASEQNYCSLIVIGVPTRLKRFNGQSLFLSRLPYALVREKYRWRSINSRSIALRASIFEKLCCASSVTLLPLPDLFPPIFSGWSTLIWTQIATYSRVLHLTSSIKRFTNCVRSS